jgi:dihydroneopterin triphosphate diphosphatase
VSTARDESRPDGYRLDPVGGSRVRSDIVDVYVFRRIGETIEFLQLLRAGPPMDATWQPIMGHIEPGESAVRAAARELREEVGLGTPSDAPMGLWALEQVHPYFIAEIDCIVLSPRFAAEVRADWAPRLNDEHSAFRWTARDDDFMWPGQKRALEEIRREIVSPNSLARDRLRVSIGDSPRKH